jgi:hypothetical protein
MWTPSGHQASVNASSAAAGQRRLGCGGIRETGQTLACLWWLLCVRRRRGPLDRVARPCRARAWEAESPAQRMAGLATHSPTHPLTATGCREVSVLRGVVLCECQASQDIGWHCTKTAAAQCPSQISAENAASLWKDPPATRPILGSLALSRNEHPAQFGILGHAGNNGQPQLAPAARSGDLVGTAAPHLLKEVAPASRLPARDSKARAGSDHNTRLRDSPAVLVAFPGAALQTNWNSWKRLGTVSLDTHVCDPSIPSPAQHTIDNPRAQ